MAPLQPAIHPPRPFRSSLPPAGFPISTTNQNSPPAKTTPPPTPKPSSESIPQSRSTLASLHTAPPRASPSQTRDAPESAQNPSDSSKPAPAYAPEIPH